MPGYRTWAICSRQRKDLQKASPCEAGSPLKTAHGKNERGQEISRCYGKSLGNAMSFVGVEDSVVLLTTESLAPGR